MIEGNSLYKLDIKGKNKKGGSGKRHGSWEVNRPSQQYNILALHSKKQCRLES